MGRFDEFIFVAHELSRHRVLFAYREPLMVSTVSGRIVNFRVKQVQIFRFLKFSFFFLANIGSLQQIYLQPTKDIFQKRGTSVVFRCGFRE